MKPEVERAVTAYWVAHVRRVNTFREYEAALAIGGEKELRAVEDRRALAQAAFDGARRRLDDLLLSSTSL